MTTPQRIEQAKIPECDSYVTRGYHFTESELNALLKSKESDTLSRLLTQIEELPIEEYEQYGRAGAGMVKKAVKALLQEELKR